MKPRTLLFPPALAPLLSAALLFAVSCASSTKSEPAVPQSASEVVRAPGLDGTTEKSAPPEAPIDYLALLREYPPVPESRSVEFRLFPQDATISVWKDERRLRLSDSAPEDQSADTRTYLTDAGAVLVEAEGFTPLIVPMPAGDGYLEAKLERPGTGIGEIGELSTEYQPKSVRFSPDGRYLFTAHLGDRTALSQYRTEPFEWVRNLEVPEEYRGDEGFVETLILEERGELWLSQMTRNAVHVFDIRTGKHEAVVELSGKWPKVLASSADGRRVYVSCWESKTISEVDVESRKEIRSFETGGIPRGMALSPDGKELLAAIYSSSAVERIDLESGEVTSVHDAAPGRVQAMRHIVFDERRREYYITAMGALRVYRLSEEGEWLGWWPVGWDPNTCAMSPDGRYLFVSCRGPNNPDTGYLTKGYEYGKIYLIDLEEGEVKDWIWGRDQPTGLDVSPDGRYLAFTDFLTHNLELYAIEE